ncbi:MAG: hypothetical protein ABWY78_06180 [Microvirga sp.]
MATLALPAAANTGTRFELLYNPYQSAFIRALQQKTPRLNHAYTRLSLFAGRRGGKTKIGGVATVLRAVEPDKLLWVCAPTYPDLNDFVMPAVFDALPVDWIDDYKASFQTLILKNKTRIQFRSLDDPNKGRGPGLDFVWLDETRKIQELAWDTLMPALADRQGQAIFTTTPNSFDWCYRRLWSPAEAGKAGFWACRYKTIENPFIKRSEIELMRDEMDPLFFQQEFEADFVSFAGRIYDIENAILRDGDPRLKQLIPEWPKIDASRTTFMGLDPGADHPFAGVLVVACEGGLVCIGEHLERNKPVIDHVRLIQRLLAKWNPATPFQPERWAIDRSQRQTAIELTQYGIWPQQAENRVVDGIRRVQAWLANDQLFFVERYVPKLVQEMRGYKWAENKAPDGQLKPEAVWKENDDLPDALRYALMTWPELPKRDENPSEGRRDLSNFTEEERWGIERMLRINRREQGLDDENEYGRDYTGLLAEEGVGPLGDFYGNGRVYELD